MQLRGVTCDSISSSFHPLARKLAAWNVSLPFPFFLVTSLGCHLLIWLLPELHIKLPRLSSSCSVVMGQPDVWSCCPEVISSGFHKKAAVSFVIFSLLCSAGLVFVVVGERRGKETNKPLYKAFIAFTSAPHGDINSVKRVLLWRKGACSLGQICVWPVWKNSHSLAQLPRLPGPSLERIFSTKLQ